MNCSVSTMMSAASMGLKVSNCDGHEVLLSNYVDVEVKNQKKVAKKSGRDQRDLIILAWEMKDMDDNGGGEGNRRLNRGKNIVYQ